MSDCFSSSFALKGLSGYFPGPLFLMLARGQCSEELTGARRWTPPDDNGRATLLSLDHLQPKEETAHLPCWNPCIWGLLLWWQLCLYPNSMPPPASSFLTASLQCHLLSEVFPESQVPLESLARHMHLAVAHPQLEGGMASPTSLAGGHFSPFLHPLCQSW